MLAFCPSPSHSPLPYCFSWVTSQINSLRSIHVAVPTIERTLPKHSPPTLSYWRTTEEQDPCTDLL